MAYKSQIGTTITRKDAWDKVTEMPNIQGIFILMKACMPGCLLSYAHARIKKIDTTKAENSKGIRTVITGNFSDILVEDDCR